MLSLDKYAESIVTQLKPPRSRRYGTLTRIVGLTLEAKGVSAAVGSICRILRPDGEHVDAQVVGFESGSVYLMPLWQQAQFLNIEQEFEIYFLKRLVHCLEQLVFLLILLNP